MKDQTWHNVRALGNSGLIRTSFVWLFVVPAAAKLFAPFEGKSLDLGIANDPITLAFPAGWVLFYLAAVFFAIGQFVYLMQCPELINRFENYGGLQREQLSSGAIAAMLMSMLIGWKVEKRRDLCRKLHAAGLYHGELRDHLEKYARGDIQDLDTKKLVDATVALPARIAETLPVFFDVAERTRGGWLFVCDWCFKIGGGLFACAAGKSFFAVMRIAFF